jgi:hypothetical protein
VCCSVLRAIVLIPESVGMAAFLVRGDRCWASRLASLSAASFPSMPRCPRAYLIETSCVSIAPWHSRKAY